MKPLIKYLYKKIVIAELTARLDIYEDAVAHRGNELGEDTIVEDLRDYISVLQGNGPWWLKGI